MMRLLWSVMYLLAVLFLLASVAQAQPAASANARLTWEQDGANEAEVLSYVYRYYPDFDAAGVELRDVVCAFTVSTFTCAAPFPAFTPQAHILTLTAGNDAGESLKSEPFPFVFIVLPAQPRNLRIAR